VTLLLIIYYYILKYYSSQEIAAKEIITKFYESCHIARPMKWLDYPLKDSSSRGDEDYELDEMNDILGALSVSEETMVV
jgi:hypothetical protein